MTAPAGGPRFATEARAGLAVAAAGFLGKAPLALRFRRGLLLVGASAAAFSSGGGGCVCVCRGGGFTH